MIRSTILCATLALATSGPARGTPVSPATGDDPAAAVAAMPDGAYLGTWENPSKSVQLRIERCGERVCGTVVFANEKAMADARRGGTDPLVGVQLFEEFRATGPRVWRGRVFVPDMNRRVTGTATLIDDTSVRVRGCAVGGIICRNQVWTRVIS
jgi:uncharacterized protein (DUF2147 family)